MTSVTALCKISLKSDYRLLSTFVVEKQFLKWRLSTILKFRGPMMGSLKTSCRISYIRPIETIALNCLVFDKIAFCVRSLATDRRTDGQHRCLKLLARYRKQRLNNSSSSCGGSKTMYMGLGNKKFCARVRRSFWQHENTLDFTVETAHTVRCDTIWRVFNVQ